MKTLTLAKAFAAIAVFCLAGSVSWEIHVDEDKTARTQAWKARCDKAYADNERIAQVVSACARDTVVRHYDDVSMMFYAGLVASGFGAVLLYSAAAREQQGR